MVYELVKMVGRALLLLGLHVCTCGYAAAQTADSTARTDASLVSAITIGPNVGLSQRLTVALSSVLVLGAGRSYAALSLELGVRFGERLTDAEAAENVYNGVTEYGMIDDDLLPFAAIGGGIRIGPFLPTLEVGFAQNSGARWRDLPTGTLSRSEPYDSLDLIYGASVRWFIASQVVARAGWMSNRKWHVGVELALLTAEP